MSNRKNVVDSLARYASSYIKYAPIQEQTIENYQDMVSVVIEWIELQENLDDRLLKIVKIYDLDNNPLTDKEKSSINKRVIKYVRFPDELCHKELDEEDRDCSKCLFGYFGYDCHGKEIK